MREDGFFSVSLCLCGCISFCRASLRRHVSLPLT